MAGYPDVTLMVSHAAAHGGENRGFVSTEWFEYDTRLIEITGKKCDVRLLQSTRVKLMTVLDVLETACSPRSDFTDTPVTYAELEV